MNANGCNISSWGDKSVPKLGNGDTLYTSYWILHFKQVDFTAYKLHLNKTIKKKEK